MSSSHRSEPREQSESHSSNSFHWETIWEPSDYGLLGKWSCYNTPHPHSLCQHNLSLLTLFLCQPLRVTFFSVSILHDPLQAIWSSNTGHIVGVTEQGCPEGYTAVSCSWWEKDAVETILEGPSHLGSWIPLAPSLHPSVPGQDSALFLMVQNTHRMPSEKCKWESDLASWGSNCRVIFLVISGQDSLITVRLWLWFYANKGDSGTVTVLSLRSNHAPQLSFSRLR